MKFKIGDRVRVKSVSRWSGQDYLIGQQGVIVGNGWHIWRWEVHLDGNPEESGFNSEHLEPIVNPDETAWNEFKRYLQPDPAVILAKEPA